MSHPLKRASHAIRDVVRSQLWPIPTLGVVLALAAGIGMPYLDALIDGDLPDWLNSVVFSGDAGAARTVLDAVSSSLITVTSLTFSLTVVTLQLASSQFSPRLLRTFTKDLFVQVTLALFLATFTFSLTVLRIVRSAQESGEAFVPRISVTMSFLLAIASVIGLVLFLAHLTRQIRVETMLRLVHVDATQTADSNLTRTDDAEPAAVPPPMLNTLRITARHSGFLLKLDEADLMSTARGLDAFLSVDRLVGDFVVAGTPIATLWRHDGRDIPQAERDDARLSVCKAIHVGSERTGAQDVGFGLRQMVDVANKALSPGINDPTTAVHALGHISALLSELTGYRLGPAYRADDDGIARLKLERPTFAEYLETALTQPLLYGSADPLVATRLLEVMRDVAWTSPSVNIPAITEQLLRIVTAIDKEEFDDRQRAGHLRITREIQDILGGARPAGELTA